VYAARESAAPRPLIVEFVELKKALREASDAVSGPVTKGKRAADGDGHEADAKTVLSGDNEAGWSKGSRQPLPPAERV